MALSIHYIIPFWSKTDPEDIRSSLLSLEPDLPLISGITLVFDGGLKLSPLFYNSIPDSVRSIVTVLYIEVNQGPGYARNFGASHVSADLIFFLDAGDINLPGRTLRQSKILAHYSFSYGGIIEKSSFTSLSQRRRFPTSSLLKAFFLLPFRNPLNNVSLACRRDHFLATQGFAPLRLAEDWVFVTRILRSQRLIHISSHDFVLVITGSTFLKRRSGLRIVKQLFHAYCLMVRCFPILFPLFLLGFLFNLFTRYILAFLLPVFYSLMRQKRS